MTDGRWDGWTTGEIQGKLHFILVILYINSRSASVCPSVTRQFRVLIRRRNRPGQSDPGQLDSRIPDSRIPDATVPRFNPPAEPARTVWPGQSNSRTVGSWTVGLRRAGQSDPGQSDYGEARKEL
ncbi:unnamed protein product [Sphagnum jensenii]|uniref:Uncharacterized protein n=1 Tax=Sphagnum jensenii TaxID=128206 RepID=A0ABP0ZX83_9BRYO